jgi:CBS domain-containing protein
VTDAFCFDSSPFDCLSPAEQVLLRKTSTRIAFRKDEALLSPGVEPQHVFAIVHGHVQQEETGDVVVFGPGDHVGFRSVLTQRVSGSVVALDPVEAWRIPRDTVQSLLSGNSRFSAMVFAELSRRLSAAEDGSRSREFLSLMMVRLRDAYLRKPFYVDGHLDLVTVCRQLAEQGLTNALVRDARSGVERIGMFTTTDLRDALLGPVAPDKLAVREVAKFELITLPADAELVDALLAMIHHRVHRILVKDGDEILGILSQLDLMGFVSNQSHLIALQVQQATTVDELRAAMAQQEGLVAVLHRGGMRIELIAGLVSELNSQVFARLWSFVASADLVRNSCLIVMGSEGRSEQILKTDQDNALLLRDGWVGQDLRDVTRRFSEALLSFGYPVCPGRIMVTNPLWCQPVAAFKDTIREWLYGPGVDGPMNFAIFMDARAVAGDAGLLREARDYASRILTGSDAFFSRFASAVDQFSGTSGGWWSRLTSLRGRDEQAFDLKKLGTFPIVHGVRALALEHRLEELGTVERLQKLADRQAVSPGLVRDLVEALHFLMTLKLRNNLRQLQLGQPVDNLVALSSLGSLDRDRLKDSLAIIKRFRQHLGVHFKLEA